MRYLRYVGIAICLMAVLFPTSAKAERLDDLMGWLSGSDGKARGLARQLLPREGVAAVPQLIGLVRGDEPQVWTAAWQTLADIGNEVNAKGREAERAEVAAYVMRLLDPAESQAVKERGLRLCAIVVAEGYDVSPIAAQLADGYLGDFARRALEEINTSESRAALRKALQDGVTPYGALSSLARMRDPLAIQFAVRHSEDSDPAVRAAVARCIAWTGSPQYVNAMRSVRDTATPETAFEANDAFLRYSRAMVDNGGNWDFAMALLRELHQTSPVPVVREGALIALAKCGDETCIPYVAEAGAKLPPDRLHVLAVALGQAEGKTAIEAVAAVYPTLPEATRLGLLQQAGPQNAEVLLPFLTEAAKNTCPIWRQAGLSGLAASRSLDALRALMEALPSAADDTEKTIIADGMWRIARQLQAVGQKDIAGQAYLALYGAMTDPALKAQAMQGISECPVMEACDAAMAAAKDPVCHDSAVQAILQLGTMLVKAGQPDKALAAYKVITEVGADAGTLAKVVASMAALGEGGSAAELLGSLRDWRLAGPFAWKTDADWEMAFVNEPSIDFAASYENNGRKIAWKRFTTHDDNGIVDMGQNVAVVDRAFGYAYTVIEVEKDTEAIARLGSDDGYRLWVNDEMVKHAPVDRGCVPDSDSVPVKLKAGRNTILLKSSQGAGGWLFCIRLTNDLGIGVKFKTALDEPATQSPA